MALAAGTRLGPYEVVGPLGAGGMGEVYRARDSRLDREVAIKVLPESVSGDADRRARFEREAKAVAALSHPNILAIHDIGEQQGVTYAVTELLHGETVRERLNRGALPSRKAIDIAGQIARGLAAAHARGIVHRDLKPENIFLLEDGHVKILDFGLARQAIASAGSGATETVAATDPGTVMGTVGYMAPEQVRGEAVDSRTDLFALGAVLYEMLSGQRAFKRTTAAETMTAILNEDPPALTSTRADLPPALDRIVSHCLEKNRLERFQSARDVAFALDALSGAPVASGAAVPVAGARRTRGALWIAAAALVAGAAIGLAGGWKIFARADPAWRFDDKTLEPQWVTNAKFSPDGQTIVLSAALTGNSPSLYVIRPDSVIPQPFGPTGAQLLSVSSRGELAVITGVRYQYHRVFLGTLARMTTETAPRPWLDDVRDADWSPDGSTVAVVHLSNGKDQLEYPLGHVLLQTTGYFSDPRVSPDGTRVAFLDHAIPADDRGYVKVVDQGGHVTTLTEEYSGLQGLVWMPGGRALAFSASPSQRDYEPLTVDIGSHQIRPVFSSPGDTLLFDAAPDGRLLFDRFTPRRNLRGRPPGGAAEQELGWLNFSVGGFFNDSGALLAFSDLSPSAGNDYAVALRHTDGSGVVRLGPGGTLAISRDGKHVLAELPSTGKLLVYPTGAGSPVTLDSGGVSSYRYIGQFFAGDTRVIVCGSTASGTSRCYQQPIAGGPPQPVTAEGVDWAVLAPDERTLLIGTLTGEYLVGSLGSTETRPARGITSADRPLAWSRDGRSFFVQAGQTAPGHVERVDISTGTRTPAAEVAPPDRSGLTNVRVDQWADDGRYYTYRYTRTLSALFVGSRGQ